MSINRFPYQDDILRRLSAEGTATVSQVAESIAGEGRHAGEGHDSPQLHQAVAENIDHLVNIGLAEYTGSGADRAAKLTAVGEEAVSSLP